MESRTYTIPEVSREKIQKTVARYEKKAKQYGVPLNVEFGEPYAKEYTIYALDHENHCKVDTHRKAVYEVFDLTIEGEQIKKEGYTVAAKIEHLDGGNVVSTFEQTKQEWTTMKPHCDHCNGNHGQLVTFIVRHESGIEKQVGRTCLKDYCGIDPQGVGIWNELNEIIEGEDGENFDWIGSGVRNALDVREVLAAAVLLQRTKGYISSGNPGCNKDALISMMNKNERATDADYAQADILIAAVKEMSREDAYWATLDNVKTLVESGYCKFSHCGYMAYAPLAYERYLKKQAEKAEREAALEAARNSSDYVGEKKQRFVTEVRDFRLVTSWETQWGWTYLYKFTDENGNVFVWYASKQLGRWVDTGYHGQKEWQEATDVKQLKVTVKDHCEYEGVRQTVVTNCALVA